MRFDKLEFGGNKRREQRPGPKAPHAKDDTHWLDLADRDRRRGDYDNALRFYSRALELDKSFVLAWVGQVQMLVHLREYPQAELWSQKALELFPSNPDLMAGRAQALCRMGDLKKAHALSDGSLKLQGQAAYRWQVRGEIMLAAKQEMDRHCFDKAQQVERDWLIPLETALIYLFYRVPSKALQRARTAVESEPEAYYPWYVQGVCQRQLGFDSSASSSFERCLELCPQHVAAQERLAEIGRWQWPLLKTLRRFMRRN